MVCTKILPPTTFPHLHPASSRRLRRRNTFSVLAAVPSSTSGAAAGEVEHVVLFKLRPEATATGADAAMLASLQGLSGLPGVAHLHAGPVLRLCSPAAEALAPTHLLHSRYPTKADLAAYASHPDHVAVVQAHVLPNALDATAVDWVNAASSPFPIPPGSAVRLTFGKVKNGVEVKDVVEKVAATAAAGGAKVRVSFGENFSPARAKGYQYAMMEVFGTVEELDAADADEANAAAVRPLLEEVAILDFVA